MRRPIALAGATLAAAAAVAFASPVAFAATVDAPVAGTAACTNLVNDQTNVINARANVQAATNVLNADLRADPVVDATVANDRLVLQRVQANLNNVVANVTASLCTGTVVDPTPTPVTTTPAPVTDTTTPPVTSNARPVVSEAVIEQGINNLSCTSTTADLGVVDRQIAAREAAGLDVAVVVHDLNAKLATVHCTGDSALTPRVAADTARACGCVNPALVTAPVVEAPGSTGGQFSAGAQYGAGVVAGGAVTSHVPAVVTTQAVNPLATDGSVATTSGSEIAAANVPAGSAQTGAE